MFVVLNKVAKGWRWVAEEILLISSSKCDEIEHRCVTQEKCLKDAIQFWIKRCVFASWRFLIYWLDGEDLHETSNEIRHLAEPITGKSLTL